MVLSPTTEYREIRNHAIDENDDDNIKEPPRPKIFEADTKSTPPPAAEENFDEGMSKATTEEFFDESMHEEGKKDTPIVENVGDFLCNSFNELDIKLDMFVQCIYVVCNT